MWDIRGSHTDDLIFIWTIFLVFLTSLGRTVRSTPFSCGDFVVLLLMRKFSYEVEVSFKRITLLCVIFLRLVANFS